tara:strand:- start:4228 stop:4497 length:270 start_codon:yes stop_codon:yes gene_type:complete
MKSNKSNKSKSATSDTKPTSNVKSCCSKQDLTAEKRIKMIAEAAYFRAEKRNFCGTEEQIGLDWQEAETEIDCMLSTPAAKAKETELSD